MPRNSYRRGGDSPTHGPAHRAHWGLSRLLGPHRAPGKLLSTGPGCFLRMLAVAKMARTVIPLFCGERCSTSCKILPRPQVLIFAYPWQSILLGVRCAETPGNPLYRTCTCLSRVRTTRPHALRGPRRSLNPAMPWSPPRSLQEGSARCWQRLRAATAGPPAGFMRGAVSAPATPTPASLPCGRPAPSTSALRRRTESNAATSARDVSRQGYGRAPASPWG